MIYRNRWIIKISLHTVNRARERRIDFDMVENTIKTGKIERFGKNMFRFVSRYKRGNVVCIGERKFDNFIKIVTVEWTYR